MRFKHANSRRLCTNRSCRHSGQWATARFRAIVTLLEDTFQVAEASMAQDPHRSR